MSDAVIIPTTEHLVEVLWIKAEGARRKASRASVLDKPQPATFDTGKLFNNFLERAREALEEEGAKLEAEHVSVMLSRDIASGDSWQLGMFVALALSADARMRQATRERAHEGNVPEASRVVWATGAVGLDSGRVNHVDHVPRKVQNSLEFFQHCGKPVLMLVPEADAGDVDPDTLPGNVTCRPVASLSEALEALALRPEPAIGPITTRALTRGGAGEPEPAPPSSPKIIDGKPAPPEGGTRKPIALAAGVAALALLGGGAWALYSNVSLESGLIAVNGADAGDTPRTAGATEEAGDSVEPVQLADDNGLPEPPAPQQPTTSAIAAAPDTAQQVRASESAAPPPAQPESRPAATASTGATADQIEQQRPSVADADDTPEQHATAAAEQTQQSATEDSPPVEPAPQPVQAAEAEQPRPAGDDTTTAAAPDEPATADQQAVTPANNVQTSNGGVGVAPPVDAAAPPAPAGANASTATAEAATAPATTPATQAEAAPEEPPAADSEASLKLIRVSPPAGFDTCRQWDFAGGGGEPRLEEVDLPATGSAGDLIDREDRLCGVRFVVSPKPDVPTYALYDMRTEGAAAGRLPHGLGGQNPLDGERAIEIAMPNKDDALTYTLLLVSGGAPVPPRSREMLVASEPQAAADALREQGYTVRLVEQSLEKRPF